MKLQINIIVLVLFCCTLAFAADNIPEQARKHMARGEAAIEEAKDASDYTMAAKEFEKAVELIGKTIEAKQLTGRETSGVLRIITDYASSWFLLQKYYLIVLL